MVCSLSIITGSYLHERSIPCRKLSTNLVTLAQNLISNTCAKVIEFINQIITSPDFLAPSPTTPERFYPKEKTTVSRPDCFSH